LQFLTPRELSRVGLKNSGHSGNMLLMEQRVMIVYWRVNPIVDRSQTKILEYRLVYKLSKNNRCWKVTKLKRMRIGILTDILTFLKTNEHVSSKDT